ncbi:MAG TPA: 4-hydroxy-tetrahydrodipicolinate synthase [Woeseiaceae bacterium]|jgi:4-hydroxy-tetrahydrodipicolinate synthase|nr:4-hydroxy-tetrahydrodipicolinate synthase [Woeseiaceae bacterium]|tara:strand:+ start:2272 stop:3171 length:900 start_codon:yes stop_codon:yes gene_type:complete
MAKLDAIKGSIPPIITPIKDGQVDYSTYARLIEYQINNGSHGILVNGTTAEPSTLSAEERNKLIDVAMETTNGKLPVIAGTGSQSFVETEILTNHAINAGVDALLIVTPYYIKPPQRGLIDYFLNITKNTEIPWMIYHIPGRTAVSVALDSMKELQARSPNFVGMKHAVNDLGFVTECFSALGNDFKVFVGLEELSFPMMSIGACGLMNAVGNLRPKILSEMCEAIWENDMQKGRELHQTLLEINQAVFYDTNPIPIKYMMKKLNIMPSNEHRLPMTPATPELEKRLDEVLSRSGLLEG